MYRVSKRGREMAMGWLTAVELIVILIDEVILGTIPKPACPQEVVTRSSKSQRASERDDIVCNFPFFILCLRPFCLQTNIKVERERGSGIRPRCKLNLNLCPQTFLCPEFDSCMSNFDATPAPMHFDQQILLNFLARQMYFKFT